MDSLARSADHKWAVFAADQFYLYSSDSSSFTTVPVAPSTRHKMNYGIRGYAMNADGSVIAVASAEQVTFLNRSFTVLGTTAHSRCVPDLPICRSIQRQREQVISLNIPSPCRLRKSTRTSYNALGYVSATVVPDDDNLERMLTTDAEGRAYFAINGGLRVVELSQSPVPNPDPGRRRSNCPNLNAVLPLNQSQQVQLLNQPTNMQVYVGGQTSTIGQQCAIHGFNIPASPISGPADIECIDSYGNIVRSGGRSIVRGRSRRL